MGVVLRKVKSHPQETLDLSETPKKDKGDSSTLPSPVIGEDGRTKPAKRKVASHHQSPAKRQRLSEAARPSTISQDEVKGRKRKRELNEGETPSVVPKRRKGLLSLVLNADTASSSNRKSSNNNTECCKTSEWDIKMVCPNAKTAISQEDIASAQRAEFEAKYKEEKRLGEGGCGSVFAGYRRADHLPVAIKHVPNDLVYCKHTNEDGREVSVEVAAMQKLKAGTSSSAGKSAPVALLDWYELEQELILVLERPVSAVDLLHYTKNRGGTLQEEEAKVILKQLVDAAIHLQENSIFHRDIKPENILIETDSDVPRVRLIDFGLSCFPSEDTEYGVFYGTTRHVPPEWLSRYTYSAGPTTVWQMGVVLFEILHSKRFATITFFRNKRRIKPKLSKDCRDFLKKCFTKDPEKRPTLEDLQSHPWLA